MENAPDRIDRIIVLGQRWTDHIGSRPLDRMVVEALVLVESGLSAGLYSLFYDANAGKTITDPFHWWHRGITGLLPHCFSLAVHYLTGFAAPGEVSDFKEVCHSLEALYSDIKRQLEEAGRSQAETL